MVSARRPRQDSAERRARIAEAALRVLGEQGPRKLTHRNVDAAAELPPGSVNYHAPNRMRLLQMAADELFAQDMQIAARHFWEPHPRALFTVAVAVITEMTAPAARYRVVARHHLLAEARTDEELRRHFDDGRAAFVSLVRQGLADAGLEATTSAAELCVVTLDGLVNRQVFFPGTALNESEVRRLVALLGKATGPGTR
ncbi:TetR/AcrR family transcriptional regulator [Nocardia harenae]|uniref:TetR/AcrR family transcriptional regulator n=1 Tax=Nocardia harenae TaxID=358707 RepID=UPI0012ED2908|nr:TetR family transcriptional regulator [Nocardia harenae]